MTEITSVDIKKPSSCLNWSSGTILGFHVSAIIETLLGLTLITVLAWLVGSENRFLNVSPHPFWIVVLLITVQYGTWDGILSAVLASFFLYVGNIPEQEVTQTVFQYQFHLSLLPILWFTSAFVLGELRMRQKREKECIRKECDLANAKAKQIGEAYETLKVIKEDLEVRLASQFKTSALTFKIFKAFGTLNPSAILINLDKVIVPTLNPTKFSVYSFGPNGFEPAIAYGWTSEDKYLRRFTPDHPLYKQIVEKQRVICVINAKDEKILSGEGVLVGPLIDEEGSIFGLLKIEEIPFSSLNLSNLEVFKTLCELIGIAYSNAKSYKMTEANAIINSKTKMYSHYFYQIQTQFLTTLAQLYKLPLTSLTIVQKGHELDIAENIQLLQLFKKFLPDTAQIFEGKHTGYELVILLYGTPLHKAEHTAKSIFEAIKHNDAFNHEHISYTLSSLYDPGVK